MQVEKYNSYLKENSTKQKLSRTDTDTRNKYIQLLG